jgi:thiol-disulfide isomerase/thioredoxin
MRNHDLLCKFLCLSLLMASCHFAPTALGDGKPDLQEIDDKQLAELIGSFKNERAILINVWATWCAPCVKEFPDIVKLQKRYRENLQVVFISVDFPDAKDQVISFLHEQGVDWTTYLKRENDEKFINAVSQDWSGAIPVTLIIGKDGRVITLIEGATDYESLEKSVSKAISNDKDI